MAFMEGPVVTVVIAAHQEEDAIERCVRSVLAQTVTDVEVVVVDDGSTDRTRERVAAVAAEDAAGRVVLAPAAPNAGPSVARNRGLALARGRWIGFLDADDEFHPEFLERMLAAAGREPAADVVVCAHRIVGAEGEMRLRPHGVGAGDLPGDEAVLAALEFGLSHYVWDKLFAREVLGEAPFPEGVHRGEDLPVVLRAFGAAGVVRVLADALVTYYVGPTSLTWGRVAPVEESHRLVRAMRAAVAPLLGSRRFRRAVGAAEGVVYLNAAHQALARHPRDRALEVSRRYAEQVPWPVAARAVRTPPYAGAALALLKTVPGLYRHAYRRYILRAYELHD